MPLTLNRYLSDPTKRERDLLQQDLPDEEPDNPEGGQIYTAMAAELETKIIQVNKNTNQKLIVVTQDKTLLCLKRNLAKLGKKEWVAPLSTVTTLLIALITSNFKEALGLGPAEWRAIFIVSAFITTGWLAHCIRKALHARNFNDVVRDIVFELGSRKRVE